MEKKMYIRLFNINEQKKLYMPCLEFVSTYNICSLEQLNDIFKEDILYLTDDELAKLEGRYHD